MVNSSEGRISRVIQDLRREPMLRGREPQRQSLADRMNACATPGASIAVIEDFRLDWEAGFGSRAAATAGEVVPSTPFQSGSISKAVFALAAMRLVEDGRIDLDADVNDQLTSWKVPTNGDWTPRVTLRQLLSHTAGTTVHGFPGYLTNGPWPTVPEILSGTRPTNTDPVIVDTIPGLQFRYSGGGTTIAQQLVVDVVKKPFPQVMHELILGPVGMLDSTYEQPLSPAIAERAAVGHRWNGVPTAGGWHVYPEMAAAGLWTTAGDLARLGVEVMRALRGEHSLLGLKPETLAKMVQPQLPGQKIGDSFVGLGWFCDGKDDAFRFGHGGANEGFLARMRIYPTRGTGAAIMINSLQGWPLIDEILIAIGREYGWPAEKEVAPPATMANDISYAGIYRNPDGVSFRVTQTPEALLLHFGMQPPLCLKPTSRGEFFAPMANLRTQFERIDAGVPASMTVIQNEQKIIVLRESG